MIQQILKTIYPLNNYNIILADGRFPKDKYLQSLLKSAKKIIACDGATKRIIEHNIIPDYIIGDCDSISQLHYNKFKDKIIKLSDQNSNDLTKAVNLADSLKLENIVILGATGMREDHAIANISLLLDYTKKIKKIAIISDYGIFNVCEDTEKIKTIEGQQISFFSTNVDTKISCQELKWPLNMHKLSSWFNGTLNQATHQYIFVTSTAPIIVYRAFCIK